MVQRLKQSTAIIVRIGPFVDVGDGFTPETGVALGTADEAELLKHNSTTTVDISSNTFTAITGCDGWYGLSLATGDVDTLGHLEIMIQDDSLCLPVHKAFEVVPANVWDSLYGTDLLKVDLHAIDDDETAADNLESACDNYSVTRGLTGTALPAVVGGANGGVPLVGSQIPNANADAAGGLPISDAGGLDLDTQLAATNEITAARMSELDAATAGKMANQVDEIRTDTEDLQTQIGTAGAGLTALGGMSDAMVDQFFSETATETYGTAVAGSIVKEIADNAGGSALTEAGIADAVWDEAISGHVGAGSAGNLVERLDVIASGGAGELTAARAGYLEELAAANIPADIDTIKGYLDTEIAAILAAVDTEVAAIKAVTDNLPNSGSLTDLAPASSALSNATWTDAKAAFIDSTISSCSTLSAANVNAEVVDVLRTDSGSEVSSVPGAAPAIAVELQFLYQWLRNQVTITDGTITVAKDDDSSVGTAARSDDGTTYTKAKFS